VIPSRMTDGNAKVRNTDSLTGMTYQKSKDKSKTGAGLFIPPFPQVRRKGWGTPTSSE